MSMGIGYASYVSFAMQTAFRSAATPTITAAHIRGGPVFSPRQTQVPRVTTTTAMKRAGQLWDTMGLVDFTIEFEMVANATAWLALHTAAWCKRLKAGAGPFTHTYTVNDPPMDGGTDGTPANTFYNHGLTIRNTIHDGTAEVKTYQVADCCPTQFVLTMPANEPLRFGMSGVGQTMTASTATAFTDVSGTLEAWKHAYKGANSGIYVGATNPPALNGAESMIIRRAVFTLENNLSFEPGLGTPSGQELLHPTRADHPAGRIEFEMDYEDAASVTDAVQIMTDYIAGTEENARLVYYVDANNALEIKASGATKPGVIDSPRPSTPDTGRAKFSFNLMLYPDTISDLSMIQTTAS